MFGVQGPPQWDAHGEVRIVFPLSSDWNNEREEFCQVSLKKK